jgi:hypothetical protein
MRVVKAGLAFSLLWSAPFSAGAVGQDATDQQSDFALVSASVIENEPMLKVAAACQTYTSAMQKLGQIEPDYQDVWQMLGAVYYEPGCHGGCDPRYTLNKLKREMVTLIDNARSARISFVQLTSIDFVNKVDEVHGWVIPNDAHDLQSGYPIMPGFVDRPNPFSETYNESKISLAIESKYVYLRQAWNQSKPVVHSDYLQIIKSL